MCACFVCVGVLLFSDWPEGDGGGGAVGGANRSLSSTRISTAGRLSINNKMRKKISRDQKIKTKKKERKEQKKRWRKIERRPPTHTPTHSTERRNETEGGAGRRGRGRKSSVSFLFFRVSFVLLFFFWQTSQHSRWLGHTKRTLELLRRRRRRRRSG